MYIVLLSGGSGKRLWPLSNDLCSKQYLRLVDSANDRGKICSMLQRVNEQLCNVGLEGKVVIAASASQTDIIKNQLGKDVAIAIEPERRDTFPATVLASAFIKSELNADEDEYVVVMPVDPYTEDNFFELLSTLGEKVQLKDDEIGLIGVEPTYPSEKYGYIIPEKETTSTIVQVKGFKEKPTEQEAQELINKGSLWNCGVFCFKLSLISEILRKYGLDLNYSCVYNHYKKLPKSSFDYEVLEKSSHLWAIRYQGTWKDLGTWNTLTEEMNSNTIGRCIIDKTCENTHAINVLDIPILVMGVSNAVVVASNDGILVADKHQSSFIKEALKDISDLPKFEEKRWGTIKTVYTHSEEGTTTTTQRVKIMEGHNTSYHAHLNQDNIITVISGDGEIIIENCWQMFSQGDTVKIPKGTYHAIKAHSDLRLLEIKLGNESQDEVERKEYNWEKIKKEYI